MSTQASGQGSQYFRCFLKVDEAASALEYAMLVGVVAVAIGVAIVALGDNVKTTLENMSAEIPNINLAVSNAEFKATP